MEFNIEKGIEILERTPSVLKSFLQDLSDEWISENEGENTWSPFDVVGHLIHGEKTDWITRANIILSKENRAFKPFDRFAQFEHSKGKSMNQLLEEFEVLRTKNLETLKGLDLSQNNLHLEGTHPELGKVTLKQLLSTWVVHDLGHISQISRAMAKQYRDQVGVWEQYLGILHA